jgi:hypothetical protein
MDLREIDWEGLDFIELAAIKDTLLVVLNKINFPVP